MFDDLVERHDDKETKGFFCMQLVTYIDDESDSLGITDCDEYSSLWRNRFALASSRQCAYRFKCPIYKKTIEKHSAIQQNLF